MQKRLWYARKYSRERHEGSPHLCLCMHLRNREEGPRKPEIRLRWVESGGVDDEKGRGGGSISRANSHLEGDSEIIGIGIDNGVPELTGINSS